MTVGYDSQSVNRIMDKVEERAEFDRKALRERFRDVPLGQIRPSDEQFVDWFEMKASESPPAQITFVDGTTVFASPWVVALSFAEGGDAILRRYNRLRGS